MIVPLRPLLAAGTSLTLIGSVLTVIAAIPAVASQPSDPGPPNKLPSSVPSAITPAVNDGRVFAIAQNGSKMIIGGSFTQVGGSSHTSVAAFDKTTGALSSTFAPSVNGDVNAVLPGPTTSTVYIGGTFTQVNGVAAQFVAELDMNTGALVSTFTPPKFNFGYINDMVARGNRLYVAGTFTMVGGKPHAGLASLNATTGALDPFMNVQFTGHHNDSGSGAQGWVGPWDIDATANGNLMAVVGNFKYADGLLRDQVALLDLSGPSAQVAPWSTSRYSPYCFNWAFDSYVRGVSFSPDGSYFVVNATGGGNAGTLCDATSRFETNLNDTDAQPTWVDETGGDTVWGVTVTNTAVYIGGHNRWNNNPLGVDHAQPGAVPRPGLAALDPVSGRPFAWNPGRKPLGVAVFAVLATTEGLWIGSNTDWVGNFQYKRPKLAFFPYDGGYTPAATNTATLPGTVYLAGAKSTAPSNVLYRVDSGGPAIQSLDSGPDWAADNSDPSPYRNNGSNTAGWDSSETIAATVPASTPRAIFESERWSPSDNPAMDWAFPVAAGTPIEVRLYFANRYPGTSQVGQRVFNVALDGTIVLDHYDIVADVGDQVGTMKAFDITSDGTVNIDFSHVVENPLINGIEIVRTDVPPPPPSNVDTLNIVAFDGTIATASTADNQGIDFGSWRGAFQVGNKVFYGYTDGYLYSRSIATDGTLGSATKIDPYNDPFWSDIDSDDGTTFRGMVPSLYGQIPNITGMFYSGGRLYYTLFGNPNLFSRWFNPDAGIVDERTATSSSSVDFSTADGMFVVGGNLYYASRTDNDLREVSFSNGTVSGTPTLVSGPSVDGVNWSNRAMFLGPDVPNSPPTAAFGSSCTNLDCSFDGSGSTDSDGSITSYSWDFGDSQNGGGVSPAHSYSALGTYTVTLTVTDNKGASDTVSHQVTVRPPNAKPMAAFTSSCANLGCAFDGSGSVDSDGSITSYSWNFGDPHTGSGVSPSHTYDTAGTYTVTLTVTDNDGATDSITHPVSVTQGSGSGIAFVGSANAGGGNAKTKSVTIPAAAQAGNTALLFLSQPATMPWSGPTGVTGWTQVGSTFTNGGLTTTVWAKQLAGGDAGSNVQFSSATFSHASVDIAVYSGVDAVNPVGHTATAQDTNASYHTTASVNATAGNWVVSMWSDRSTSTRTWTTPGSVAQRGSSTDSGSLTIQAVIADSSGPVSAGATQPITASTDANTDRTAMWTVELDAA